MWGHPGRGRDDRQGRSDRAPGGCPARSVAPGRTTASSIPALLPGLEETVRSLDSAPPPGAYVKPDSEDAVKPKYLEDVEPLVTPPADPQKLVVAQVEESEVLDFKGRIPGGGAPYWEPQ